MPYVFGVFVVFLFLFQPAAVQAQEYPFGLDPSKLCWHPSKLCPAGTASVTGCLDGANCDRWCNHNGMCDGGYYLYLCLNKGKEIMCTDPDCSPCTKCGVGKYTDREGQKFCKDCPKGKYSSTIHLQNVFKKNLVDVHVNIGATSCKECDVGRHQDRKGQERCEDCEAGKYAPSKGLADCKLCGKGHFSRKRATSCKECDVGRHQNGTGQERCEDCEAGKYTPSKGLADCTPCPAGKFQNQKGASKCFDVTTTFAGSTAVSAYTGTVVTVLVGAGLVILVVALVVLALGKRGQQKSGSEIPTGGISAAGSTETLLQQKMVEMSSNNTTIGSSMSITSTEPVPLTEDSIEPTTTPAASTNVETTVDPIGLTTSSNSEPLSSDDPNPSCVVVNGPNDEFKTDHTSTSENVALLATHDGDTATTAPTVAPPQRTFATSNYKRFYERAEPAPFQHNLLAAVHSTVTLFAARVNPTLDEVAIEKGVLGFMEYIQDDAFKNDKDLRSNVDCVAEYLWTSSKRHDIIKRMELCSVLNAVIREDIAEEIEAAAVIFRSINSRRVNREAVGNGIDPTYPHYGDTWRGGGFRNHCRPFFDSMLGKKYRVPGFLATSTKRGVATKFAFKADPDHPRTVWRIRFDRRGKHFHKYRVQHMSIVTKTLVKGECEFLFAPYSVFKLQSVKWSTKLSEPHQLIIEASNDNREESEDLPLTPWY